MVESAVLLVDKVFAEQPVRQWVLSVPFSLRFLFASRSGSPGRRAWHRLPLQCYAATKKAGFFGKTAQAGEVTVIRIAVYTGTTSTANPVGAVSGLNRCSGLLHASEIVHPATSAGNTSPDSREPRKGGLCPLYASNPNNQSPRRLSGNQPKLFRTTGGESRDPCQATKFSTSEQSWR